MSFYISIRYATRYPMSGWNTASQLNTFCLVYARCSCHLMQSADKKRKYSDQLTDQRKKQNQKSNQKKLTIKHTYQQSHWVLMLFYNLLSDFVQNPYYFCNLKRLIYFYPVNLYVHFACCSMNVTVWHYQQKQNVVDVSAPHHHYHWMSQAHCTHMHFLNYKLFIQFSSSL